MAPRRRISAVSIALAVVGLAVLVLRPVRCLESCSGPITSPECEVTGCWSRFDLIEYPGSVMPFAGFLLPLGVALLIASAATAVWMIRSARSN